MPQPIDLIYDGQCNFCKKALTWILKFVDPKLLITHDFHNLEEFSKKFPELKDADFINFIYLVDAKHNVYRGFYAFRVLVGMSKWLWPLQLLLFIPGVSWIGEKVYAKVAANRHCLLPKVTK